MRLLVIALLCAVAQVVYGQTIVTNEAELQSAVQTNNANIRFGNDIATSSLLVIGDSRTITIDMNGFTLDRGCTSRGSQVIVIRTGSTLNLSNGTLTGGWGGNGGALDIETNTTVNLTDVIITGQWRKREDSENNHQIILDNSEIRRIFDEFLVN